MVGNFPFVWLFMHRVGFRVMVRVRVRIVFRVRVSVGIYISKVDKRKHSFGDLLYILFRKFYLDLYIGGIVLAG